MEDLQTLRKEIDEIDNSLVALFEKRMAIAEQVAAYKIQIGKPVFDKDREQEKLSSLGSMAHNEFNRCGNASISFCKSIILSRTGALPP